MMELLFENILGLKADRNVDTKLNGGWIQLLTPPSPHPTLTFVMESLCENGLHLKAEREVDRKSTRSMNFSFTPLNWKVLQI